MMALQMHDHDSDVIPTRMFRLLARDQHSDVLRVDGLNYVLGELCEKMTTAEIEGLTREASGGSGSHGPRPVHARLRRRRAGGRESELVEEIAAGRAGGSHRRGVTARTGTSVRIGRGVSRGRGSRPFESGLSIRGARVNVLCSSATLRLASQYCHIARRVSRRVVSHSVSKATPSLARGFYFLDALFLLWRSLISRSAASRAAARTSVFSERFFWITSATRRPGAVGRLHAALLAPSRLRRLVLRRGRGGGGLG